MPWWGWLVLVLGGLMLIAWRWPTQFEAVGNALSQGGERMQRMGCALTLLVTLPIAGLIFVGAVGGVVGLVIGLLLIGGMAGSTSTEKSRGE